MYVPLSKLGIDTLIDTLKQYEDADLTDKAHRIAKALAERGVEVANVRFQRAQYDGTNDVTVHCEERGDNAYAVVAVGTTTFFIEFGTGIHYGSPMHPNAADNGFYRGTYGQGRGNQDAWYYKGESGTNGEVKKYNKQGEPIIKTHGNPANMPMYVTVKMLEQELPKIVKEVFGK